MTTTWNRACREHLRVRPLRAAAHLPEQALLHLLVRLPTHPLLRDRSTEPERPQPEPLGHLGADVLHDRPGRVRDDERGARLRRTNLGRAHGRLEPPTAADPALG